MIKPGEVLVVTGHTARWNGIVVVAEHPPVNFQGRWLVRTRQGVGLFFGPEYLRTYYDPEDPT
jgi:hypothetical protein